MFRRIKQTDRVHSSNLVPVSTGPFALGLSYVIGPDGSQLFGTVTTPIETGTFLPVSIGGGLARSNQGAAWWSATDNVAKILAPTNIAFTIVFTIQLNALGQTNKYLAQTKDGGSNQFAAIYGYVAGAFELYAVGYTGTDPRTGSQITVNDLAVHTIGYSYDGVTLTGALDGNIIFSVAKVFNLNFAANAATLYSAISGGNLLNTKVQLWSTHDRGLNFEELSELTKNHEKIFQTKPSALPISAVSAALTGTITTATEANVVTGGRTIILTLTGDTFLAAGTGPIGSTANTQALINGIDSAQAEATGWDAVVKVGIATTDVVRTSSTVATITLPAFATYNITATETITATIPAAVLTLAGAVVAAPTFQVTAVSAGGWLNRGYWWGQTYGHMVG